MENPIKKNPERPPKNKNGNQRKKKNETRIIISTCVALLSAISFALTSHFGDIGNHIGSLFIFISIGILLYGKFKSVYLYTILVMLFGCVFFIIQAFSTKEPDVSVIRYNPPILQEGYPPFIPIVIKNSGDANAENVRIQFGTKIGERGYNKDSLFKKLVNSGSLPILLRSQQEITSIPSLSFSESPKERYTKEFLDSIKTGKSYLYVYGKITFNQDNKMVA